MTKIKQVILFTMVATLFAVNAMMVMAANKAQYGYGYVTKTGDLKTDRLVKVGSIEENASNLVGSVEGGRKLCSWVNNNIGNRVTDKVSYSSADPVYMSYNTKLTGDSEIARSVSLTVSTTLTNFTSTGTFGYWSPDYITTYP